jgi:hypothetical protein
MGYIPPEIFEPRHGFYFGDRKIHGNFILQIKYLLLNV